MVQGGEDPEFIRKAIESLVKKLKDRRMQLDSLLSAVTSGGKQNTGNHIHIIGHYFTKIKYTPPSSRTLFYKNKIHKTKNII